MDAFTYSLIVSNSRQPRIREMSSYAVISREFPVLGESHVS